MIGKKATTSHTSEEQKTRPTLPILYPYLIKFLDMGLRGRQSYPEIGKRGDGVGGDNNLDMKTWLKQHIARLGSGKRGFPSFSVPDHWKSKTKSSSKPSLSKVENCFSTLNTS